LGNLIFARKDFAMDQKETGGMIDFVRNWGQQQQPHSSPSIRHLTDTSASLQGQHVRHATLAKFHGDANKRAEHAQTAESIAAHLRSRGIKPIV
jgi:hypothetical protein